MGRAFVPHIITPDSAMLGESYGINIPRSLRLNTAHGGGYLTKSSGGGSATKWTYSLWTKNCSIGNGLFCGYNGNNSSSRETLSMGGSGNIAWQLRYGGSQHAYRRSTYGTDSDHMENSGWSHFLFQWDSNNGNTADRWIVWVNGERQPQIQYNATQSGSSSGFMTGETWIGRAADTTGYSAEFYVAEMHAVNNAVLAPTHFGFTDPITGAWRPKKSSDIVAATTYGTGGWYLDFSDPSNIGADRSGNGQNWTVNGLSTSDVVLDTPTNNFCILNNNDRAGNESTNGNLQSGTAGTSNWRHTRSTFLLEEGSGRWYWEVQQKGTIDGSNGHIAGLAHQNYVATTQDPNGNSGYMYARQSDKRYWNGGNAAGHFSTTANNDIIQFAFDADTGFLWSGKNNTWTGANPATGTNSSFPNVSGDVCPFVGAYGSSIYSIVNFGQQPFTYTPPTGFRAICSKNYDIQGPTVVSPKSHFNVLTYSGNGSNGHNITGLEFQPDFVWIKVRNTAGSHYLVDSVRGLGTGDSYRALDTAGSSPEYTNDNDMLRSLNSDGFTLDNNNDATFYVNRSSDTYVAWCWKAGGAAVSNTDGTITSSVSANKEAGFSIVSYTGNEVNNATVGHGLGASPDVVIIKDRDTNSAGNNWYTFHSSLNSGNYLKLNSTDAQTAVSGTSNGGVGSVTSTTFNFIQGTSGNNKNVNENGDNFIAYCWRSIPGYSKMGIFTGNGNGGTTQPGGIVVRCGFKPALVILRSTGGGSGSNWGMFDFKRLGYNKKVRDLRMNTNSSEGGDDRIISLESDGFRITSTSSGFGGSDGQTYVFMAWAENPGRLPFNMPPTSS